MEKRKGKRIGRETRKGNEKEIRIQKRKGGRESRKEKRKAVGKIEQIRER